MARFDPREKEVDRLQGWNRGAWVELVLTRDRMVWKITVLVDGELFATFDEDTDHGDIVDMVLAEERFIGTFESLLERFLAPQVAA